MAGAGRAGYLPKHFDGVAGATTKNGKHPHREYNKVASEVSERGQAIAGLATGEDSHRDMIHSAGRTREEGGDKNPRLQARETEERPPPERSRVPNASGFPGGEGGGGNPTQQRTPTAHSKGTGGDPQALQRGTPPPEG